MGLKKLKNPFPTVGYHGAEYFCDRKEETKQLLDNLQNGNSTTLLAVRRIGKTGLIHHTFSQLPQNWKGIYVDILATENLNEFLNRLATAIVSNVPERSSLGKRFWTFLRSLRPVIHFDPLTGEPQASFVVEKKEAEQNITSLLQFLEQQDFKTVIAIDEFQQILNYPEKNTEAWLRGIIQDLQNVVFIFSGSSPHLLSNMFAKPNKPFFRSTQLLPLKKIDLQTYTEFIVQKFNEYNKDIDYGLVREIVLWNKTHTYYVQLAFNSLFSATEKKAADDVWRSLTHKILQEQEIVFIGYRNMLTNPQWQLLKAIAKEGEVYMPTSKEFISKHKLGGSSTVLRSLQSLQNYELIYTDTNSKGERFFTVYDVLFSHWCIERAGN